MKAFREIRHLISAILAIGEPGIDPRVLYFPRCCFHLGIDSHQYPLGIEMQNGQGRNNPVQQFQFHLCEKLVAEILAGKISTVNEMGLHLRPPFP